MGQLTISMAIFNSFLYVYQRVRYIKNQQNQEIWDFERFGSTFEFKIYVGFDC